MLARVASRAVVSLRSTAVAAPLCRMAHTLKDRERAAEAAFFNAEEERLLRNLLKKNEAAKEAAAKVGEAAKAPAAGAPKKSKEEEALEKIVPAASAEVKAKLIAWRHETF